MNTKQITASEPKNSVWVSASAGTGKTKILTDRVLRLLLDGNEPSKILCLTFTKAAAAEMSVRINNELSEWVAFDEKKLIKRLTDLTGITPEKETITYARKLFIKVLDSPDNLKIQTIHSFCQFLIKKFPLESDINPNFEIIDDHTSKLLIQEAKNILFDKISAENQENNSIKESIKYISWHLQDDYFDKLIEEIISKSDKITQMINYHQDVDSIFEALRSNLSISEHLDEEGLYKEFCKVSLHQKILKTTAEILVSSPNNADINRGKNILLWMSYDEEEKLKHIQEYINLFLTKEKEALKNILSRKMIDSYPEIYSNLMQEQERIKVLVEKQKSLKLYTQSKHIIKFSEELLKEYTILKYKNSYLDYNDLISLSYRLLKNNSLKDWILYKLDGGIDHILVDEAQDTSKEQWQIIENLTSEFFSGSTSREVTRTLFVVGDEKQSIFSFQGADPATFNYMHNYFANKTFNNTNIFKTVKLDTSFRSSRAVLEVVDRVFSSKALLNTIQSHDTVLKHISYRNLDAGKVSLWPLIDIDDDIEEEIWPLPINSQSRLNSYQKLGELIAIEIENWLNSNQLLKSKNRPIAAGDILILVRRRNEFIDFLIKELKRRSIPVAGADRLIINQHIAIMDLIALGKFLLLPSDDLNLACLLKSPLIGMSEDELFTLAHNRDTSLWETLKDKVSNLDIYKNSFDYLDQLLKKVNLITIFSLYNEVIETLGGRKKFHARLGDEVNDLLDEFLNLILKYESTNLSSLQKFLQWLESTNIEIKRDLEQSKDHIRIMTIHSAKGLQAPIVILPDTNFSTSNFDQLLFCDIKNLLYWPGSVKNHNIISNELKNKNLNDDQNEFNRLLYVALTRAEDEIIVCGIKNRNSSKQYCWYNIIKNSLENILSEQVFCAGEKLSKYLLSDKQLVLEYEQQRIVENLDSSKSRFEDIKTLPEFITKPIQVIKPLETLAPSSINNYNIKSAQNVNSNLNEYISSNNASKGIIIHKLLEHLPSIYIEKREEASLKFLNKFGNLLNDLEKNKIIQDCLTLLDNKEFKNLWNQNSRTEIEISGVIGKKYIVSGKIDRLIFERDKIIVIDYKTTNNPPKNIDEVPDSYTKQMAVYRFLLSEAYPDKNIECYLIWTSIPEVMIIPNEILEEIDLYS